MTASARRTSPNTSARRRHGRELFGRLINGITLVPRPHPTSCPVLVVLVHDVPEPPELDVEELLDGVAGAPWPAIPRRLWEIVVAATRSTTDRGPVPGAGAGFHGRRARGWRRRRRGDVPANAVSASASEGSTTGSSHSRSQPMAGSGSPAAARCSRASAGSSMAATSATAYNYGPPARDTLVETPDVVGLAVVERGPIRGAVEVVRSLRLAGRRRAGRLGADGLHRRDGRDHPIELRAGEPFVRVDVAFDEPDRATIASASTCHSPRRSTGSSAEGQFAVVERGLTAEGGHGEVPLPTFPAHGFVQRRGAERAPRPGHRVRGRRWAGAGADPAALARADQPQRQPVPRGSGRPRGPGARMPSWSAIGRSASRSIRTPAPGRPRTRSRSRSSIAIRS